MIKTIKDFVTQNNLIPDNAKIVLGLSGGPDSVFLLHFLADLRSIKNIQIIAAHLDHEWRPDSGKDVEFCKHISEQLDIPFITAKLSELPLSRKWNGSKEEIGRIARRYFLEQVRTEYNADLIALGHHLQDQEETFFIRLIRGSSLTGLTCMYPKNGIYIRPLLETNKKNIVTYLDKHNITYLIDLSNESPEFLRNRIRSTVLPPLHAVDSRFDQNFLATLKRLQATEDFLDTVTHQTFAQITKQKDDRLQLNIKHLLQLHPVMQYRILMFWLQKEQVPFPPTQRFLDEILRFINRPGSKEHVIHEAWQLVKKKNWIYIAQ